MTNSAGRMSSRIGDLESMCVMHDLVLLARHLGKTILKNMPSLPGHSVVYQMTLPIYVLISCTYEDGKMIAIISLPFSQTTARKPKAAF